MTTKRRIAITDEYGEHVAAVYVPEGNIDFESATLEGFAIPGLTTLRGRSFRNRSKSRIANVTLVYCRICSLQSLERDAETTRGQH